MLETSYARNPYASNSWALGPWAGPMGPWAQALGRAPEVARRKRGLPNPGTRYSTPRQQPPACASPPLGPGPRLGPKGPRARPMGPGPMS